uniref:TetR/AcrR family transcriptional regulator n=1 Tax=Nocardia thailandica TaxID=257275 RepID=UPI0002D782D1|nr:TetR/AcrR family transcriptional regulator [Nocardia thailandica]
MSTAGTKGVPRAEREQQILDAAAAEIGRVGYAGLSPAEVGQRAGVSKPLVYAYFGSKDGLYIACVERAADLLERAIEPAITGRVGVDMALATLDAIFTALEPRPHDWSVLFDRSHPDTGPAADAVRAARRRIAGQAARGVTAGVAGHVADDGDLSAITDVWMGSVTALVHWWLRHPDENAAAMSARSRRLVAALAALGT